MESGMAIKATLIIISNSLKILRWFVKNLNQKKTLNHNGYKAGVGISSG